jgi:hypothetical protein
MHSFIHTDFLKAGINFLHTEIKAMIGCNIGYPTEHICMVAYTRYHVPSKLCWMQSVGIDTFYSGHGNA